MKVFTVKPKTFSVDFILLRNKRPKMMKMFYGRRFTSKQTEPWYLIFTLIDLVWLSTYLELIGKVLKTLLFWPEQLDFVFLVLAPSLMQVTPCSVLFQISN